MTRRTSLSSQLRTLREAFDGSFAAPIVEKREAAGNFLALRLGKRIHALPLGDIVGLFARRPVTPLPTSEPALLGLANFSGAIAAVFDLHLLLGFKPVERPAWLAMATALPVAFAFEGFEGHLRVAEDDIVTADEDDTRQQAIRMNGVLRPVVHLSSIIATIETRMSAA